VTKSPIRATRTVDTYQNADMDPNGILFSCADRVYPNGTAYMLRFQCHFERKTQTFILSVKESSKSARRVQIVAKFSAGSEQFQTFRSYRVIAYQAENMATICTRRAALWVVLILF
jgi:hypothetical protein